MLVWAVVREITFAGSAFSVPSTSLSPHSRSTMKGRVS